MRREIDMNRSDRFMLLGWFGTSISQISCVMIWTFGRIECDIMSKSGAGGAGGVFFVVCLKSLGMATLGIRLFERFH